MPYLDYYTTDFSSFISPFISSHSVSTNIDLINVSEIDIDGIFDRLVRNKKFKTKAEKAKKDYLKDPSRFPTISSKYSRAI